MSATRSTMRSSSRSAARSRTAARPAAERMRSEEHTSELQSRSDLVCRLLLEKKKKIPPYTLAKEQISSLKETNNRSRDPIGNSRSKVLQPSVKTHVFGRKVSKKVNVNVFCA